MVILEIAKVTLLKMFLLVQHSGLDTCIVKAWTVVGMFLPVPWKTGQGRMYCVTRKFLEKVYRAMHLGEVQDSDVNRSTTLERERHDQILIFFDLSMSLY